MAPDQLQQRVEALRGRHAAPRIVVVGDAMLDRYHHHAAPDRHPMPAPGDVTENLPGGAANVAANAAALSGRATLVAAVGMDVAGEQLAAALATAGVAARLLEVAHHPTTIKTRRVVAGRVSTRHDRERPLPPTAARDLRRQHAGALRQADVVILSDYAKGALADVAGWIALCRAAGTPVLVDSKNPAADCRGADLATPNLDEACALLGRSVAAHALADHASALLARLGTHAVLVTLGGDGMLLLRPRRPPLRLPAFGHGVDPTGAGDTVVAAVAIALATGAGLAEAALFAAHAAATVVARTGTAVAPIDEVACALAGDLRIPAWGS
jgi:D-beta-D-heptose 7-phosphate kinase/D-beta-D-heptose 1-phosphate adenosyltransferase